MRRAPLIAGPWRRGGRHGLRLALAAAAVVACGAQAANGDLERIMQALAANTSGTAQFTEVRTVALLRAPIESRGTLSHGTRGRLEKHTTSPQDEKLIVEDDTLTIERAGRGQRFTMRLADQPGVQALIEGLRGTLAGDLAALRRHYRVELGGDFERWEIFLLPRDPTIAELVSDVRIAGARDEVRRVEIREASGDRSSLTLSKSGT